MTVYIITIVKPLFGNTNYYQIKEMSGYNLISIQCYSIFLEYAGGIISCFHLTKFFSSHFYTLHKKMYLQSVYVPL